MLPARIKEKRRGVGIEARRQNSTAVKYPADARRLRRMKAEASADNGGRMKLVAGNCDQRRAM